MTKFNQKGLDRTIHYLAGLILSVFVIGSGIIYVAREQSGTDTTPAIEDSAPAQLIGGEPASYTEQFSDQQYYDINYTSADWNTGLGVLTLPSNRDSATGSSLVIDNVSDVIPAATLTVVEQPTEGSIAYFLSNDNGLSFEPVTPGQEHVFGSSGSGLRWRAELQRGPTPNSEAPIVDSLSISFETKVADHVLQVNSVERGQLSIEVARELFSDPNSANAVLLGRDDGLVDSFVGTTLASRSNGPILFTDRDKLDPLLRDEISRLLGNTSKRIYILGGTSAISESIVSSLKQLGYSNIKRLDGQDRFETSTKIAGEVNSLNTSASKKVFLSEAQALVDAFAIAGVAGDKKDGVTDNILLTGRGSAKLPSVTRSTLSGSRPTEVIIVGGTQVVPASIESEIKSLLGTVKITRLAGADRFSTNKKIIDTYFSSPQGAVVAQGQPLSTDPVGLYATLLGAVMSSHNSVPLILTEPTSLTSDTTQYLFDNAGTLDQATVVGTFAKDNADRFEQIRNLISHE